MKIPHKEVIIVGAGLAGLSCARRLMKDDIPFLILEADQRIGGRVKTDRRDGFILNHGFQVLQTDDTICCSKARNLCLRRIRQCSGYLVDLAIRTTDCRRSSEEFGYGPLV